MPMYKKRRVLKRKAPKRSYAMVPRPLLNREMGHRHIVTMSTSSETQVRVTSPTSGISVFGVGVNSSANMSLEFSLASTIISLGGLPSVSIANPSVAELQQLYDTFQIEKVEITIFSGNTQAITSGEVLTGPNFVLPLIGHAPDTDDQGNTSLTQLQQYSNYRCDQLGQRPIRATVVPCVAGQVYLGAATTGYTRLQRQDINVAQAGTPHYGYKLAVDGFRSTPNALNCLLSFQFRIHYLMKSTR